MEELYSVFVQEAREQLAAMEAGLLKMEQGDQDPDLLNAVFRAAHTIKGASGVVEIHHIEKFTHILENLLDKLRNGKIAVSSEIVTALLRGCDHIGALLDRVEQGQMDEDQILAEAGKATAELLHSFAENSKAKMMPEATVATVERARGETTISDCWHISIRFGRDVLKMGMEPLAFFALSPESRRNSAFDNGYRRHAGCRGDGP